MEYTRIQFCVENAVGQIVLNSPKNLNAFDETMSDEMCAALDAAMADESVKVIVISAEGKAFSAGGDIHEMVKGAQEDKVVFDVTAAKIADVTKKIVTTPKPVIASVFGAVAGAAFNIAVACDFCIAAENAKFIQAFVNIGLIPDAGGLFILTRSLGISRAMQLAMLGTPVTAAEGKEMGFVYQVCAKEDLAAETAKLAARLAAGPSTSYGLMKELVYTAQFAGFEEYTAKEVQAQYRCGFTHDFKEGVFAFTEKRKPEFNGK